MTYTWGEWEDKMNQLARQLYELMGGIEINWSKEAAVVREEYRKAAGHMLAAKELNEDG